VNGAGARSEVEPAAAVAGLAHGRPLDDAELALVRTAVADDDERVRVAALGALVRGAPRATARAVWREAMVDRSASVRRRAAELACAVATRSSVAVVVDALGDRDVTVVEAACWALGELGTTMVVDSGAIDALVGVAGNHADALAREAAVAALGALGDARALPAILAATHDKPAVRRRAVLALAAYDSPEVDAALQRALDDRDWQVRQAAEDLTRA